MAFNMLMLSNPSMGYHELLKDLSLCFKKTDEKGVSSHFPHCRQVADVAVDKMLEFLQDL
jgi:hypothetical protein